MNEDVLWVEKLKEIAQRKNLGEPKLQHHELKTTGRFLATITLAGESYLTYPQDFADLMDAYEEAARQVQHFILKLSLEFFINNINTNSLLGLSSTVGEN